MSSDLFNRLRIWLSLQTTKDNGEGIRVPQELVPKEDGPRGCMAVFLTTICCIFCTWLGVEELKTYGVMLFVGLPLLMGFIVGWIDTYYDQDLKRTTKLTLYALLVAAVFLVFAFIEGVFCLVLAFPIVFGFTMIGTYVGIVVGRGRWVRDNSRFLCTPIIMLPALMCIESSHMPAPPMLYVSTPVVINAPASVIWNHVTSFDTIGAPSQPMLKCGIAYPITARLEGTGLGATRLCQFSTGTLVEKINGWNEPDSFAFSVEQEPSSMTETSLFKIHPHHLDGYLKCREGFVQLIPLSAGRTEVVGSTWYTDNIWPQAYWSIWSNEAIHEIHLRVLEHVKAESELEWRRQQTATGQPH